MTEKSAGSAEEKNVPKQAERLLYLYNMLHSSLPYGGLSFQNIMNNYYELIANNNGLPVREDAIRRMIYRDLKELEQMGMPLERPSTGSRKYCLRGAYLPKLTRETAASIYTTMLLYRGTLLDQAAKATKNEIERMFSKSVPERLKKLEDRIYVVGDTLVCPDKFGNILGTLIRAVTESFRIHISYVNISGKSSERTVEPLGMVCKRSVWYVIAHEPLIDEIRTFRVDQIGSAEVRERETFVYPDDFCIQDYISSSWGVFKDDPVEVVRLKFSPEVALRIKNICYHPSQKLIKELLDGSVIIEYKVCGLIEMKSWIMQWGNRVTVLEPERLRQQLLDMAREMIKKYEDTV